MTTCIEFLLTNLAATFGGNFGWAIAVLSLAIRLALLPVALRAARHQREVAGKTLAQLQKQGIPLWHWSSLVLLLQIPLMLSLNQAVQRIKACRFLWIADLTKPDVLLVLACAAVAAVTPPDLRKGWMPALFTCVFLWKMSSGVALYSLASGLVGVLQARLEPQPDRA